MRRLILLVFFTVIAGPLAAQKKCTKGIPCGNTCISAKKTCRIGSSPAKKPVTQRATTAPTAVSSDSTTGPWVREGRCNASVLDRLTIYLGPDSTYRSLAVFGPDSRFCVSVVRDGFYRVEFGENVVGWIDSARVIFVQATPPK